jgi:hypothetical protein
MLRPDTGEIVVDDGSAVIGPNLTLAPFLASDLGAKASPVMAAGGWSLYKIGFRRIGGEEFSVSLHFNGEFLGAVYLYLLGPPKGLRRNMSTATAEKLAAGGASPSWIAAARRLSEQRRAGVRASPSVEEWRTAAGSLWLAGQLGGGADAIGSSNLFDRAFRWGTAASSWDPRNAEGEIVIRYGRQERRVSAIESDGKGGIVVRYVGGDDPAG